MSDKLRIVSPSSSAGGDYQYVLHAGVGSCRLGAKPFKRTPDGLFVPAVPEATVHEVSHCLNKLRTDMQTRSNGFGTAPATDQRHRRKQSAPLQRPQTEQSITGPSPSSSDGDALNGSSPSSVASHRLSSTQPGDPPGREDFLVDGRSHVPPASNRDDSSLLRPPTAAAMRSSLPTRGSSATKTKLPTATSNTTSSFTRPLSAPVSVAGGDHQGRVAATSLRLLLSGARMASKRDAMDDADISTRDVSAPTLMPALSTSGAGLPVANALETSVESEERVFSTFDGDTPVNSRDLAAELKKPHDWLKFWGGVEELSARHEGAIEVLSSTTAERDRLLDDVAYLKKQLAAAHNECAQWKGALEADARLHTNMMLIERDKFDRLMADHAELTANNATMRHRVTAAEAVVESLRTDAQELGGSIARLTKEAADAKDRHALELLLQKKELTAQFALDEEKKARLETLEAEHGSLKERTEMNQQTIDILTSEKQTLEERLNAANQAAGATFLRKFGSQLNPGTVQQLMKFTREQGDVIERITSLTHQRDAAKGRMRALQQAVSDAFAVQERWRMQDADMDALTGSVFTMGTRRHPSRTSVSGKAHLSTIRYDAAAIEVPRPPGPSTDSAGRKAIEASHYAGVLACYREAFFEGIPAVNDAFSGVINLLWAEVCRFLPADTVGSPDGARESLHRRVMVLVAAANGAIKALVQSHLQAVEQWKVSIEAADKQSAAKEAAMNEVKLAEKELEQRYANVEKDLAGEQQQSKALSARLLALDRLCRATSSRVRERIQVTQFEVKACPPHAADPPESVDDVFSHEELGGEAADLLSLRSHLHAALAVFEVSRFCDAIRHEHRSGGSEATSPNAPSPAGGATATTDLATQVRELKTRVLTAEEGHQRAREETLELKNDMTSVRALNETLKQRVADLEARCENAGTGGRGGKSVTGAKAAGAAGGAGITSKGSPALGSPRGAGVASPIDKKGKEVPSSLQEKRILPVTHTKGTQCCLLTTAAAAVSQAAAPSTALNPLNDGHVSGGGTADRLLLAAGRGLIENPTSSPAEALLGHDHKVSRVRDVIAAMSSSLQVDGPTGDSGREGRSLMVTSAAAAQRGSGARQADDGYHEASEPSSSPSPGTSLTVSRTASRQQRPVVDAHSRQSSPHEDLSAPIVSSVQIQAEITSRRRPVGRRGSLPQHPDHRSAQNHPTAPANIVFSEDTGRGVESQEDALYHQLMRMQRGHQLIPIGMTSRQAPQRTNNALSGGSVRESEGRRSLDASAHGMVAGLGNPSQGAPRRGGNPFFQVKGIR